MFGTAPLGAPAFQDPDFGRPAALPPPKLQVGSAWGPRTISSGHDHHEGLDIALPVGTPLLAIGDGTVIRVQPTDVDAAGIWVGVKHDNGMVSRYLHNSKPPPVALGQRVRKGDVIGYSGNTGSSSGPHLHLALHAPAELLPAIEAAGGKPKSGWGPSSKYGVAIPAEPWVPVDGYRLTTQAKLAAQGIPIRTTRSPVPHAPRGHAVAIAGAGLVAAFSIAIGLGLRRRNERLRGTLRAADVGIAKKRRPDKSCSDTGAGQQVTVCLTKPRTKGPVVAFASQACDLLHEARLRDRESFYTISIDVKNQVLGVEEVARGSATSVDVHPREVFKSAILLGAAAVILAHNHPSGRVQPSREDEELTQRMASIGKMIGIPVLDHVIIGGETGCFSFGESSPQFLKPEP